MKLKYEDKIYIYQLLINKKKLLMNRKAIIEYKKANMKKKKEEIISELITIIRIISSYEWKK